MISNQLPTDYQNFIALSRYARWKEDEQRRETWSETVARYFDYMAGHLRDSHNYKLSDSLRGELEEAVLNQSVMPSMRALMTAGPALDRCHVGGYNCSYIPVDSPRSFDECMYILMCGTGVGFSVERQYINELPDLPEDLFPTDTVIKVADSKIGWAKSYKELLSLLYAGQIPTWDVSNIRPYGARLKTFGGRASGPAPLEELFEFTINIFRDAMSKGQRKLVSIDCHDLMCKVAEVVVVGGVRRSALISLSTLSDNRMRNAKSGAWWEDNQQRALSNNSVAYTDAAETGAFMREWLSLYESKSGERGIFNRQAAEKQASKNGRREDYKDFGCNPCSEIILRSNQFCNLSEVVVREKDDLTSLKKKVKIATIIGTLQSTLTDFRYLRVRWKRNTEEEALLGVSLTGIMDHYLLSKPTTDLEKWLTEMKDVSIKTNKEWADKLGVNQSVAITCVKPSGTVSQLVDSASGIHPRFSSRYIRRVRSAKKDPLAVYMTNAGFPVENDVMSDASLVFSFPVKAPSTSVTVKDVGAMEQLKLWKTYQNFWCEHKPSITIYYTDDEYLEVAQWIWDNFDICSGISLLPYSDHVYQQAPYEEIDEEKYKKLVAEMPQNINWEDLAQLETEDNTVGSQELACVGGACEI